MAKCKNCGADIPEGREYCESCEKEVSFPEISGIEDLFGIEEPVVEKAEEAAEQKPELSEIDDLFGAKLVENPADLFGIEGLFETETAEAPAELSGLEDIFGMESVEETELPEVDNLFETKEEVSEMSGMEDIFASLDDTSEETAAETVEQEPALSGI